MFSNFTFWIYVNILDTKKLSPFRDGIHLWSVLYPAYDYLYKYDFDKLPETILDATNNRTSKYGERLRKLVYRKKRNLQSNQDRRLLIWILNGKTQLQIADELHVSLGAVKKKDRANPEEIQLRAI